MLFHTTYQGPKDRVIVSATPSSPILFVRPINRALGVQRNHELAARDYVRTARPTWEAVRLAGYWMHDRGGYWRGVCRWMLAHTVVRT